MCMFLGCASCKAQEQTDSIQSEQPLIEEGLRDPYNDRAPEVTSGRKYQLPVDTKIGLAGSYGELRPNHFHAGLDFKTDQSIGHPVYSFADGYVRRAAINARGYGLVLYVEHPHEGLTSVYAHLEDFCDKVWDVLSRYQVEGQLNNADVTFKSGEIPVNEGEIIAKSGNTGSSGGPHVHFELRNITGKNGGPSGDPDDDDDILYDPQMYWLDEIQDTRKPDILNIYLYRQTESGPYKRIPRKTRTVGKGKKKRVIEETTLRAWGKVGLALKTYDHMDGQGNNYGVKDVRLYMTSQHGATVNESSDSLIYHFRQNAFRFSESRYTNSTTDYAEWFNNRSMIFKAFVEPGNLLQHIDHSLGNGIVDINEERTYNFRFEVRDAHDNVAIRDVKVIGSKSAEVTEKPVDKTSNCFVHYDKDFTLDTLGIKLSIPKGTFYNDFLLPFHYDNGVYYIGDRNVPWHEFGSIEIQKPDSSNVYLADLEGGIVTNGRIRGYSRLTWKTDTWKPEAQILPRSTMNQIEVKIGDRGSGVKGYRLMIDGKFVPCNMNRYGRILANPKRYGIESGKTHDLELTVWDYVGNETVVTAKRRF